MLKKKANRRKSIEKKRGIRDRSYAPQKKKNMTNKRTNIRTGNISDVRGTVNIAGGNITTHQTTTGLSGTEIKQLFEQLNTAIESSAKTSPADKEDLKEEVREIQSVVIEATQKNEKVDESYLLRRFRNIARMAPDVLDVIVSTLASPLAGLGVAVKKIAEKAKEEIGQA